MEQEEIDRRLREARRAVLGTADGDGQPHLVPIVFASWRKGLYTAVDGKPKTTLRLRRLANIKSNPRVSVLIDHYEDDWSRLWWIRVDGEAHIRKWAGIPTGAQRALTGKYPAYAAAPPPGPVIAVDIDRITHWSAS